MADIETTVKIDHVIVSLGMSDYLAAVAAAVIRNPDKRGCTSTSSIPGLFRDCSVNFYDTLKSLQYEAGRLYPRFGTGRLAQTRV